MRSCLPLQPEFQNGGFGDPHTLNFGGQVEENTNIQACPIASNEELSQEFIDPLDACLHRLEESTKVIINSTKAINKAMAKLKDKLSTPTPSLVSRFDTLGLTSGLNVSKLASNKVTRPPGFSQGLAPENPTLGGQRGQGITLGGQNSQSRPSRIPEQQQGLDDKPQSNHNNDFRPERKANI
ncbi:hypothetical protein RHMOL_Rhmol04G0177400 [Rhododendron molle]|uniref:Uncharacterized protein n=1 Tax=Rhododendron molle TaxID=49168 RepID=A0ACC0P406_RHOML|nr:hypothetical protein RHMOL_Rhmol04G0177400 [Rhododendron molle]